MPMIHSEVFISYAWGGKSEEIAAELHKQLHEQGLTIVRDKMDLRYMGLITDFMKRIGVGKAIVVVISDKYLKSPYCMFELIEIYRNRNFSNRTFPIIMDDAAITHVKGKSEYFEYWQAQKADLEATIEKLGVKAITVIGDDYKNYDKIVNNFGDVINELKDINALTPRMHKESNFSQLFQSLKRLLEEDFHYTRHNDIQKLRLQLTIGSQEYYKELSGTNGPFQQLNISEAILAGISQLDATDPADKIRLETTVKNKNGEERPLENCLHELWEKDKPNIILLGNGGMGKTVSLVHLWETFLTKNQKNREETIPVFLNLHEYNIVSERERQGFIIKRIAWHYLGIKENQGETINALWNFFKTSLKKETSSVVLFLDGFNEVTVEKNSLLLEIKDLCQKSKIIQIVLSSRYTENNFTWADAFQTLELQLLDEGKVKSYLDKHQISHPEDHRLLQIIQNPMMLTLYANANEIIDQYKSNRSFDFKYRTSTQGEMLWNYLETQVVKLAKIYGYRNNIFNYHKFLIRHLLPYLGYQMEQAGQYVFSEDKILKAVRDACQHFFQQEFLQAYPEYGPYLKNFNLKQLDFIEEAERFEQIITALCIQLRLIKRKDKVYEFIHQNFRDYFAASHILNELQRGIQNKKIPKVLSLYTLSRDIRQYVGQIAGEHYQTEFSDSSPTILMQTLDSLRDIFETKKLGYAVWNIVNIWRDTRFHLGNANFSRLNLLGIGLQDTLCYHREGSIYQSACFDESLINEKCLLPLGHSDYVTSIAIHPHEDIFISGSKDSTIKVWNSKTRECLSTLEGHNGHITSIAFHPEGGIFVSAAMDNTIKIWDLKEGICLTTIDAHSYHITCIAFHPKGNILISGSWDNTIKVWNLMTRECLATLNAHNYYVTSLAFHPDGSKFISGSIDKTIKVWNLQTKKCIYTLQANSSEVSAIAFHPKGNTILSGSWDKTIKAWDLEGNCLSTFEGHDAFITCIAFYSDGKTFISAGMDAKIKIWDVETGNCLATYDDHSDVVTSIAIHQEGNIIISAAKDNTIKLWDIQTGSCTATIKGHNYDITSGAIQNNGNTFISAARDNTIKAWDLKTGKCLATFFGHKSEITCIAMHPYDSKFISAAGNNTIKAWDLKLGKCFATINVGSSKIVSIVMHPDGKSFISGHVDNNIKIWDLTTKECLATLKGHNDKTTHLIIHPNGNTLTSVGVDNLINVWDLKTNERLATVEKTNYYDSKTWIIKANKCITAITGESAEIAFHPNGDTFIVVREDKNIKTLNLNSKVMPPHHRNNSTSNINDYVLRSSSLTLDNSLINSPEYGEKFVDLVLSRQGNNITMLNQKSKECLATFKGHEGKVTCLVIHPNSSIFFSGSRDKTIKLWDLQPVKCLVTLDGTKSKITRIAIHPDNNTCISVHTDNSINIWDLKERKCIATLKDQEAEITVIKIHYKRVDSDFDKHSDILITGGKDNTIKIWDIKTNECILKTNGKEGEITSIAVNQEGNIFITGSTDGTINAWDINTGKLLNTFVGHKGAVTSIAIRPYDSVFISGSTDNTMKIWNLRTSECLSTIKVLACYVTQVSFYSNANKFISISNDNSIKVWDYNTNECLTSFVLYNAFSDLIMHPNCDTFIGSTSDNNIKLLDLYGNCLTTFKGHKNRITSMSINPTGNMLISAGEDFKIKVWELKLDKCLATLNGNGSDINSLIMDQEGKRFIASMSYQSVKIWDINRKQSRVIINGLGSYFRGESFLEKSDASTSTIQDNTIKVWNILAGNCLATLKGSISNIQDVFSNLDIVIEEQEGEIIRIWDLKSIVKHTDSAKYFSAINNNVIEDWKLKTGIRFADVNEKHEHSKILAFDPVGNISITLTDSKVIELKAVNSDKSSLTLRSEVGLQFFGCSFKNLHPSSQISKEAHNILCQHGVIFNNEDAEQWEEAIHRVFND